MLSLGQRHATTQLIRWRARLATPPSIGEAHGAAPANLAGSLPSIHSRLDVTGCLHKLFRANPPFLLTTPTTLRPLRDMVTAEYEHQTTQLRQVQAFAFAIELRNRSIPQTLCIHLSRASARPPACSIQAMQNTPKATLDANAHAGRQAQQSGRANLLSYTVGMGLARTAPQVRPLIKSVETSRQG